MSNDNKNEEYNMTQKQMCSFCFNKCHILKMSIFLKDIWQIIFIWNHIVYISII